MGFMWTDMPDIPDTDYRSEGVHKQRNPQAKTKVEAKDRSGMTDRQKEALATAAAEGSQKAIEKAYTRTIDVDEKVKPDVAQEVTSEAHAVAAAATSKVEAGGYQIPMPGSGKPSSYGSGTGPEDNDAQQMGMDIGMDVMGGGSGQGGMSGLPQMIGQDIASIDDPKDQADDALFEDDTVRQAHQRLGEKLQGR